jgi:hypothetical protein
MMARRPSEANALKNSNWRPRRKMAPALKSCAEWHQVFEIILASAKQKNYFIVARI